MKERIVGQAGIYTDQTCARWWSFWNDGSIDCEDYVQKDFRSPIYIYPVPNPPAETNMGWGNTGYTVVKKD